MISKAAEILWPEPQDVSILSDVIERVVSVPASANTEIAARNADRVYLGVFAASPGLGEIRLSTRPDFAGLSGIFVSPTEPFEVGYRTHGPLVGVPWFAFITAAADLTIIEVLYTRRAEDHAWRPEQRAVPRSFLGKAKCRELLSKLRR